MPTMTVKDAFGANQVINTIPNAGQAANAASQPVSLSSEQDAKLDTLVSTLASLLTELTAKTEPADTQAVSAAALPLPTGASTEATLAAMNAKLPSLGPAAPSASQPVNLSNDVSVGAAASIAALTTDLLTGNASGWYDAGNFHSASIQIIGGAGISAGAIFFECTNDTTAAPNGNIWAIEEDTGLTPTPQIAAITIAASTVRMFRGPVTARFVRVRVSTGFVGGTVQAVAVFSQLPYNRMVQTVHQATAGNLNATIAAIPAGTNTIGATRLAADSGQGASTSHRQAFVANITTGGPTSVKASAGTVNSGRVANNSGAGVWVHFYNKASAPTLGTDTPIESVWVPAGSTLHLDTGGFGDRFTTGIAYAVTDNCAAVPAVGGTITIASTAAAICVSLFYT